MAKNKPLAGGIDAVPPPPAAATPRVTITPAIPYIPPNPTPAISLVEQTEGALRVRITIDVPLLRLPRGGGYGYHPPRVDITDLSTREREALQCLRAGLEEQRAFAEGYVAAGRPLKWLLSQISDGLERAVAENP